MSKKLSGHSSLSISNAPQPKMTEKLGLLSETKYINRTYRITREAVSSLEELTARLGKEAGIDIAMGKVFELIIFNAKDKSLEELLNIKK